MAVDFKPGRRYRFDTYAAQLLGSEYSAVLVKSIMTYEDAVQEEDVVTLNAQVLPFIQSDPTAVVQRDYTKLTYIKIDTGIGKRRIIAVEWIKPESIEELTRVNIQVTAYNTDPSKVELIRQALIQNGIQQFSIEAVPG